MPTRPALWSPRESGPRCSSAAHIRASGRLARDPQGAVVVNGDRPVRIPGRLEAVRAIGWYIEEYQQAQVSVNLLNYKVTPLHAVLEAVREEAVKRGLGLDGDQPDRVVELA